MNKRELKAGDVVQISPSVPDCFFGGCFMTVPELKSWGAVGFIAIPGGERGKAPQEAYFRAEWKAMEYVGKAAFPPVMVDL